MFIMEGGGGAPLSWGGSFFWFLVYFQQRLRKYTEAFSALGPTAAARA